MAPQCSAGAFFVSACLPHSERPVHSGIINYSQYLINFKPNDLPAFASIHPEGRMMTDNQTGSSNTTAGPGSATATRSRRAASSRERNRRTARWRDRCGRGQPAQLECPRTYRPPRHRAGVVVASLMSAEMWFRDIQHIPWEGRRRLCRDNDVGADQRWRRRRHGFLAVRRCRATVVSTVTGGDA
jgi:hypothetical protein